MCGFEIGNDLFVEPKRRTVSVCPIRRRHPIADHLCGLLSLAALHLGWGSSPGALLQSQQALLSETKNFVSRNNQVVVNFNTDCSSRKNKCTRENLVLFGRLHVPIGMIVSKY